MTEHDPNLIKVVFHVERQDFPEFMGAVVDHALDKANIRLDIAEADIDQTEPSITIEKRIYNPELIGRGRDSSGNEAIIITRQGMAKFGKARNIPHSEGKAGKIIREYDIAKNFAQYKDIQSDLPGINVAQATDYLDFLESSVTRPHGVGSGTLNFYKKACAELFLPAESATESQ